MMIYVCNIAAATRGQQHQNFQKIVLYHSKSTGEYYLAVVASDDSTRKCKLDLLNTHIILETKEGGRKTIDNEDLKIACLGNMYSKLHGQKYTLFRFNLIIDNSGSIDSRSMQYVQNSLERFLKEVPLVFEAQVIKFSEKIQVKTKFTKDKDLLIRTIKHPHPQGGTALFDAMNIGIQELKAMGDDVPLRFSVVFTDGRDNGSTANRNPLAFKQKVVRECKKNLIPLFIIGVTGGVDSNLLNQMAEFGMYIHKKEIPQLDQAFDLILNHIKDTYIFKIPAIGNFSDLKTIYIVRKTAMGNPDTIQDIIVH
jgi:Mg-chelatase subunit ChlD